MTTLKFQDEARPETKTVSEPHTISATPSKSSQVAVIESVLLGLKLRGWLSRFNESALSATFFGDDSIMVVRDNLKIYPMDSQQDDFPICLVINEDDLSVCDINGRHFELVDRIEHCWPNILNAVSRIKRAFHKSEAALVINRNSGRIIAVSRGFSAVSGLSESDLVGREYGNSNESFIKCFANKKIELENFEADELFLTLVAFNSVTADKNTGPNSDSTGLSTQTHHYVDQSRALGLHFDRFNTMLESNLQSALNKPALAQLERTIAEIESYSFTNRQTSRARTDKDTFLANLRLLLQSNMMSHRVESCGSAETELLVFHGENGKLQIRFDTPLSSHIAPRNAGNDWKVLVEKLAAQLGVEITELRTTEDKIVNRIYLQTERTYEKTIKF